ncbi:hypothetical protein HDV05_001774, partial [Chytridiales sp. JEL 0842]
MNASCRPPTTFTLFQILVFPLLVANASLIVALTTTQMQQIDLCVIQQTTPTSPTYYKSCTNYHSCYNYCTDKITGNRNGCKQFKLSVDVQVSKDSTYIYSVNDCDIVLKNSIFHHSRSPTGINLAVQHTGKECKLSWNKCLYEQDYTNTITSVGQWQGGNCLPSSTLYNILYQAVANTFNPLRGETWYRCPRYLGTLYSDPALCWFEFSKHCVNRGVKVPRSAVFTITDTVTGAVYAELRVSVSGGSIPSNDCKYINVGAAVADFLLTG